MEMLGRQQIAGIPTAISEIFKNAHDAYADNVEADFLRARQLLVIRDDGCGMSLQDFESRWLALGTESKVGGQAQSTSIARLMSKTSRSILGEKGIGRLAMAVIGPQVLLLTRAYTRRGSADLVVALVHWSMFQLPGLDLSELEIPVRVFKRGSFPTSVDVKAMVNEVVSNLQPLRNKTDGKLVDESLEQLRQFDVDPAQLEIQLGGPRLSAGGHGTHFYIAPTDETLPLDIDGVAKSDAAPPMIKMLIGFTNTMTAGDSAPLQAKFRDHKLPGAPEELIGAHEFFTPDEFNSCDHHIEGLFDEKGQFQGTVTVYGMNPVSHVIPWTSPGGRPTACGPFHIRLAVLQGVAAESRLPPQEWGRLNAKLDKIGGLYVYKDGIRVLPYGDTDYDYLDIEKNRSKGASYYYFSYRRIIGAIELTNESNTGLSEKAGREGFRENHAYRQFREILKNFFLQLAADFFRHGGEHASPWEHGRSELKLAEAARREREHQVRERRIQFARDLGAAFTKFQSGEPSRKIVSILEALDSRIRDAAREPDVMRQRGLATNAEHEARAALASVRKSLAVSRPPGLALTTPLRRDWEAHQANLRQLENMFFSAQLKIEETVALIAVYAQDRELRARSRLDEARIQAERDVTTASSATLEESRGVVSRVQGLVESSRQHFDADVLNILSEFAEVQFFEVSDEHLIELMASYEAKLLDASDSTTRLLVSIEQQLKQIEWIQSTTGEVFTSLDLSESTEQELLALQERAEVDLELTQLGMAIEVINHEFEATIKSIRSNLRQLRTWADMNPGLQNLYLATASSFEHLDGYLSLFTPLHRRLYRNKIAILGSDIKQFLLDLFDERLERGRVTLKATKAFSEATIFGYPSTFYPVFVNLIDNAIFWLQERDGEREIVLDAQGSVLLVSDTGPGLNPQDVDSVFAMGFTRKPQGRGLGLYIAREVLRKEGYEIEAQIPGVLGGATFRILPRAPAAGAGK